MGGARLPLRRCEQGLDRRSVRDRHAQPDRRALAWSRIDEYVSPMPPDYGARCCQTNPVPQWFCREEGIEQTFHVLWSDAGTAIFYADDDVFSGCGDAERVLLRRGLAEKSNIQSTSRQHRVSRVQDDVLHNLKQLVSVGFYGGQVSVDTQLQSDVRATEGEPRYLSDDGLDINVLLDRGAAAGEGQ